jgi:hypothetical protein
VKNFFRLRSSMPLFLIQRERRAGRYLNSPWEWVDCGLKRFPNRAVAAVEACFIVGSSRVRVVPLEEEL